MESRKILDVCAGGRERIARKNQNVIPYAQGWASMRMRILFSLIFFLAIWNGPASAGNAPPSRTMKTEVLILQDRLNQALQEEAILRAQMEREVRLATRPYAEYLLYQKSLRLSDHAARLEQLKKEKREAAQKLALLRDGAGPPIGLGIGLAERSASRDFPTYSGAPLLSFYDGSRFIPVRTPGDVPIGGHPGPMLKPIFEHLLGGSPGVFPIRIYLFRLLSIAVLVSILTLPLIAAQRMRADLRQKEIIRLFPILTFWERDGSRGMLRTVIKPKGA